MEEFLRQLNKSLIKDNRWMQYMEGLGVTILIALTACCLGLVIGLLVSVIKYSGTGKQGVGWRVAIILCDLYTTVIRGTPVIVQLLILYSFTIFTGGLLPCIIGFGINSGAYVAEIFRSGINSVDSGQAEAGRSLGLSRKATTALIVLPQAVKNILPALFNEFIALVKETSVAGYIAVRDITKVADGIKGVTFTSMPLYIAALIYLALVVGLTQLQKQMERRLARSDRD
ncbi:MAG: amino acid ABC transporter permease [Angelakisella sp.]